MIDFYLDESQKNIWTASPRNGSSLISAIANRNNLIKIRDYRKLFYYLKDNPNTTINILFRDPNVRFRSGLFINSTRSFELIENSYKKSLLFYTKISSKFNGLYPMYHLFDYHLDHILWIPSFFAMYNYNVKLIPISDFTQILVDNFPESRDIIFSDDPNIKNRGDEAFDSSTIHYDELWNIYNESIIQNIPCNQQYKTSYAFEGLQQYKISYTFEEWMKLENKLFRIYEQNYNKDNIDSLLKDSMNLIIDDPYYLMDIYSPKIEIIRELLFELLIADNFRANQVSKLINIYNNFDNYSNSLKQIVLLNKQMGK